MSEANKITWKFMRFSTQMLHSIDQNARTVFYPETFNSSFIFYLHHFDGVSAPVFTGWIANHVKHILQVFSLFFFSCSAKRNTWCTIIPSYHSRYHLKWRSLKGKSLKFQIMLYNLIYFCRVFPIFHFDANIRIQFSTNIQIIYWIA